MKKVIIFDAGALISLSMNGLLYVLKNLKKEFGGDFVITNEVKKELVDKPIKIKRFELEALRVRQLIDDKVLVFPEDVGVDSKIIHSKTQEIIEMTKQFFTTSKGEVRLLHSGESSCLALSKLLSDKKIDNLIVVDERTTRMLAEKPENLKDLLQRKLHTRIKIKKQSFDYFKNFKIIRSAELIYVAWKKGLLEIRDGKLLLDALLYALKFKGCAISFEEIEEIKKIK